MVGVEVGGVERLWIVVRCAGGAHLLRQKSDAMDRVPPALILAYYISTLLHGHFYDGALAVAGGMAAARLLLRMMPVMVYYAAKGDEHD